MDVRKDHFLVQMFGLGNLEFELNTLDVDFDSVREISTWVE